MWPSEHENRIISNGGAWRALTASECELIALIRAHGTNIQTKATNALIQLLLATATKATDAAVTGERR